MKKLNLLLLFLVLWAPFVATGQQCIDSLVLEQTDCNPNNVFDGMVTFTYSPNVDSVEIYYNNAFFGTHAAANQPIVLSPLFADGTVHSLVVRNALSTTCADSLNYLAVCPTECTAEIDDNSLSFLCQGDFLQIDLTYSFLNPETEGALYVNGFLEQDVEVGTNMQTSLFIETNSDGYYEIALRDKELESCGDTTILAEILCGCDIFNFTDELNCTNVFTFDAEISFEFFGLSSEVQIQGSDGTDYGIFNPFDQPLMLTNIDAEIGAHTLILTDLNSGCQVPYQILSPDCTNNQNCSIGEIVTDYTCNDDGTFNAFLTYENSNSSSSVIVTGSGTSYGMFNASLTTINIDSIIFDPSLTYDFTITDSEDSTCTNSVEFPVFGCAMDSCNIEILGHDYFCDGEFISLFLQYNYDSPFSEGHIIVNGMYVQNAPAGSGQQISLQSIIANSDGYYEVIIRDAENLACADTVIIQDAFCGCEIFGFEENVLCTSDSTFTTELTINFNNLSQELQISNTAGFNYGTFNPYQQPLVISNMTTGITAHNLIFTDLAFGCQAEYIVNTPECAIADSCSIEIQSVNTDCNAEGLFISVEYEASSLITEMQVFLNGTFFSNDQGNTGQIGIFIANPDPVADYIIELKDAQNPECSAIERLIDLECDPCEIISYGFSFDCKDDGTYSFSFENRDPQSPVEVFLDSTSIGMHTEGTPDLLVEGLSAQNPGSTVVVTICSEVYDCCTERFFEVPACTPVDSCEFVFLQTGELECNDNGTYNAEVFFSIENYDSDIVSVFVNNEFIDVFGYNTQGFTISDITPRTNSDFDIIKICSTEQDDCCETIEYLQPDCGSTEECSIGNIQLDYECLDQQHFLAIVNFDYIGVAEDSVEIYNLEGELIGLFDASQQPIMFEQDVTSSSNFPFGVLIKSVTDSECANESLIQSIECDFEECEVTFIETNTPDCNTDGTYNVEVFYGLESNVGQILIVSVNGIVHDSIAVGTSNSFLLESVNPQPGTDTEILTICVDGYPNCCSTIEFLQPTCGPTNCNISNLGVEYECIGEDGQFEVYLFFDHENTSGEVEVFGNGTIYGNYDVNAQPIQLGPFNNNSTGSLEFIVKDVELGLDCAAEILLDSINCETDTTPCLVEFIEVDSFFCNANGTYNIIANYEISGENNNLIEVYVNDQLIDVFGNFGSVLVADITPRFNSDFDIIKICLNDNPDCCKTIEYLQPDCSTQECELIALDLTYECDGDSTYYANVDYAHSNTSGTVNIFIDGNSVGFFNVSDKPHLIGPLVSTVAYQLEVKDAQQTFCASETVFQYDECIEDSNPCSIAFIEVDSASCNNDGTFNMTAFYDFANANNNFIDVLLNGILFDTYVLGNSVNIENIPLSLSNEVKTLTICLNDNPDCCETINYLQPDCEITQDSCSLDISEVSFACDNGELFIEVAVNNSSMNNYLVYINGVQSGSGLFSDQTTQVGPVEQNSDGYYVIKVTDATDESCFDEFELLQAFCTEDCFISNLVVESLCEDDDLVFFEITFDADNTGGEVFIKGNGTDYGSFGVQTFPIVLGPFDPASNADWEFIVTALDDENCQAVFEMGTVECSDTTADIPCIIEAFEVYNLECIGDNEYSMSVDFEVEAEVNVPFTFYVNGMLQNSTAVNSLPLNVFGVIPSDSSNFDVITICLDGLTEECCIDFEYEQPACLTNSVDQTLIADVVISPNPTTDFININDIPKEIAQVFVIDNLGRVIEQRSSQSQLRLDVANYQSGIYMIQFTTADNKIMSKRFVKM